MLLTDTSHEISTSKSPVTCSLLTLEARSSSLVFLVQVKAALAVPPEGTADHPPATVIYCPRTQCCCLPPSTVRHLSYDVVVFFLCK